MPADGSTAFAEPDTLPLLRDLTAAEDKLEADLERILDAWERHKHVPKGAEADIARFFFGRLLAMQSRAVDHLHAALRSFAAKDAASFTADRVEWARTRGAELARNITAESRERVASIVASAAQSGAGPSAIRREIQGEVPGIGGRTPRQRAAMIARTELHNAATYAQEREALRLQERGARLVKVWTATRDNRTRPTHRAANGQTRPLNEPFIVGGSAMMRPGDGPAREVINCFPADVSVDALPAAATRHWFDGELVEIATASGYKLAGTPNHPVLTDAGWKPLHKLSEGDRIVCARNGVKSTVAANPDVEHVQAAIGEVFDAVAPKGSIQRIPHGVVNFHGDRPQHDVEVVAIERELADGMEAPPAQLSNQVLFKRADLAAGQKLRDGLQMQLVFALRALGGLVRSGAPCLPLLWRGMGHAVEHGLAAISAGDTSVFETERDRRSRNPRKARLHRLLDSLDRRSRRKPRDDLKANFVPPFSLSKLLSLVIGPLQSRFSNPLTNGHRVDLQALADLLGCQLGEVEFDRLVAVSRRKFSGHVYNLEDARGWYLANRIIAHNCRCVARIIPAGFEGEDRTRREQAARLAAPDPLNRDEGDPTKPAPVRLPVDQDLLQTMRADAVAPNANAAPPPVTEDPVRAFAAGRRWVLARGLATDREHLAAYDYKTGVTHVAAGRSDSVTLPSAVRSGATGRSVILIHNHPTATPHDIPLSPADVGIAMRERIESVTVVGHKGSIFTARALIPMPGARFVKRMEPVWDEAYALTPKAWPEDDRIALVQQAMNQALAKYGVIEYVSSITGATRRFFEREAALVAKTQASFETALERQRLKPVAEAKAATADDEIDTIYEAPRGLSDKALIARVRELRALKAKGEPGVDHALRAGETFLKDRGLSA